MHENGLFGKTGSGQTHVRKRSLKKRGWRFVSSSACTGEGEKACLGEACLRWMPPVQDDFYSGWHRDGGVGAHALRRPLTVGFLQLIV